jgi:CBS domain/BON domain
MTPKVVSVVPEASILEAMQSMLANRISGLPVIAENAKLVGIVIEGDFARRAETGTQHRRSRWLELFMGPGKLAQEYVHTPWSQGLRSDDARAGDDHRGHPARRGRVPSGRATDQAPTGGAIRRRGRNRQSCQSAACPGEPRTRAAQRGRTDAAIRAQIYAELNGQRWIPKDFINVVVRNGVVEVWGAILDKRERQAVRVAVENVPASSISRITWFGSNR